MTFPLTGPASLGIAVLFGFVFGFLLQKGGVTDYAVIVNQFRLRDFTVVKVMLTAVVVGGIGVLGFHAAGLARYDIKEANLLGVALGAALFGIGMVVYGYCPGTGIAAIATGSLDALVGALGMLAGSVAYALTFPWVRDHILPRAAHGKIRLPDITGIPDIAWLTALAGLSLLAFRWLERRRPATTAS